MPVLHYQSLSLSLSLNDRHNMTPNKPTISASSTQAIVPECCMCGDSGLSHELFQCKLCQFRSQHRYCSNLYPKAEYYRVCNWCLSKKDNKSQTSSNSSSSTKTSSVGDIKIKNGNNIPGGFKGRSGNSPLKPSSPMPIKKVQRWPERSSVEKSRKRIIINEALEEKLMRSTRSADLLNNSNNGITKKHVFRNKVRRYKLLEEVSS